MSLAERRSAGAMLLQSSVIVGALREYFELLWEREPPMEHPTGGKGPYHPFQMQILRLLVQVLSHEAIADRVEVSLSTVGRHDAEGRRFDPARAQTSRPVKRARANTVSERLDDRQW
jgi:hypothetical protein